MVAVVGGAQGAEEAQVVVEETEPEHFLAVVSLDPVMAARAVRVARVVRAVMDRVVLVVRPMRWPA